MPKTPEPPQEFFNDLSNEELVELRDAIYAELARRAHLLSHGEQLIKKAS